MSDFLIFTDKIKSEAAVLGGFSRDLMQYDELMLDITRRLSLEGDSAVRIRTRLRQIISDMAEESRNIIGLSTSLMQITAEYASREKTTEELFQDTDIERDAEDVITMVITPVICASQSTPTLSAVSFTVDSREHTGASGSFSEAAETFAERFSIAADKIGINVSENVTELSVKSKKSSSSAAIYSMGGTALASWTYLTADGKWKYGSLHAAMGEAEAHATATGGLYQRTRDKQKIISPELNVSVGASVSALTLDGSLSLGDKTLGLNAGGEIEVGSAEAAAEAKFQLKNSDGESQVQIKGKASAEAVAVEASGSVKGTVLGVSAAARAGVNIGLGAHAEFSVEGTKIHCDVGASFGVGVSAGFDIDPGDALNSLKGTAQSVLNFFFPKKEET